LIELNDEIREFFRQPNFVHLAMLREDGSPQVAPVWADVDDDNPNRIVISTGQDSPKVKATRRDPRIAFSVTKLSNPYDEAYGRGRVVEWRKEGAPERMQRISHKYTGKDFPWPVEHQITLLIELDSFKTRKLPFQPPAP
jgi:PPOX class probable F420-dependent enzyme